MVLDLLSNEVSLRKPWKDTTTTSGPQQEYKMASGVSEPTRTTTRRACSARWETETRTRKARKGQKARTATPCSSVALGERCDGRPFLPPAPPLVPKQRQSPQRPHPRRQIGPTESSHPGGDTRRIYHVRNSGSNTGYRRPRSNKARTRISVMFSASSPLGGCEMIKSLVCTPVPQLCHTYTQAHHRREAQAR